MRNVKSFLVSGITLCVLYLIIQSTFFSTEVADNAHAARTIYSPFNLSSLMEAEGAEVAAPAEEPAAEPAPAEAPAEAAPAPEPAPAPAPEPAAAPAEEKKEEKPAEAAASAPAEEKKEEAKPAEEAKKEEAKPAEGEKKEGEKPAEGEKKEEKPAEKAEEAAKEELIGFETIDLAEPSGNWLVKRRIWEQAQTKYEQIKGVFDQILESRMPFFKRRAEIDRQILDPLYISAGLDREEIANILEEFSTLVTVDQERHAALDEREQKMQLAVLEEKKVLEQLQNDVTKLATYETTLDSFLDKLIEQVNVARTAEKQAWQAYKDIGKILNDKKAYELKVGMETPFKRLTDIQNYINGDFKQQFDKVDSTVQEHAKRIKDALQSLKEKGLDFKKFSKQIDEKLHKEDVEQKEKEAAAKEEAPEEEGWLAMIASWWQSFMDSLYGGYEWIMSYFTGESETEEVVATAKKPVKTKQASEAKEKPEEAPKEASKETKSEEAKPQETARPAEAAKPEAPGVAQPEKK